MTSKDPFQPKAFYDSMNILFDNDLPEQSIKSF